MPTYDYTCDACGHRFELFQPIKSKPRKTCPECGARRARRLIGAGAGILFKGSGFYETDYRSKEYREKARADSGGSKKKDSESKGADKSSASDKSGGNTGEASSSGAKA